MKSTRNTMLSLIAIFAVVIATGCTRVQQGAAAGGALGAVAGGIMGHNANGHLSTWESALVGGATGAAVGGLAGDAYEEYVEEDDLRDNENLRAQLNDAERELAQLRAQQDRGANSAELERQLAERERELERLRQQLRDAQAAANRQPPSDSELQRMVDQLNQQLANERARNAANERNLNDMRNLLNEVCRRLESMNQSAQGTGGQPQQPSNFSQYGAQSMQQNQ